MSKLDDVQLTNFDIRIAFHKLDVEDQLELDLLMRILIARIRQTGAYFGRMQAMELLSKLGIWLVQTDRRTV